MKLRLIISLLSALGLILNPVSTVFADPPADVGIWYSTWYTNNGKYIWDEGFGSGSKTQLLGDVNCDGKDDAVAFFDTGTTNFKGAWYVSLTNSGGTEFTNGDMWEIAGYPNGEGHGIGSNKQFLGDVNGDNCDDAIIYMDQTGYEGRWYVALSNGTSGFNSPSMWKSWHGSGSKTQLIADVDGNGKDDAVVFFDVNSNGFRGAWWYAPSNGTSSFGSADKLEVPGATYGDGHGYGSSTQFMADVSGDGKADAITFVNSAGQWNVATVNSTATSFNTPSTWLNGHGTGSQKQFIGDVTGDGKADAVFYFHTGFTLGGGVSVPDGTWYKADAQTSNFQAPVVGSPWKYNHGKESHVTASTNQLLGNINGSTNGSKDPVVYVSSSGEWRTLLAEQYIEPPRLNLWEAWNVKYRPMVNGVATIYDSGDTAVIDEHLAMIDNAGIDYILIDLTNRVETDYIYTRAKAVCERLATHNSNGGSLKFAVGVGAVQWTQNPSTVESEAAFVNTNFVTDATCGSSYYQYQGKPLLVAYGNESDIVGPSGWINYGSKTSTNSFTVVPALSKLPPAPNGENPGAQNGTVTSDNGSGCGTFPSYAYSSYYGQALGWGLLYGTPTSGPIMPVMPGWKNKEGWYIKRSQNGANDGFYTTCGWNRVLSTTPSMVVINSFNEFAERTAVMPTQTSGVPEVDDRWPSNSYFWDITVSKIGQL